MLERKSHSERSSDPGVSIFTSISWVGRTMTILTDYRFALQEDIDQEAPQNFHIDLMMKNAMLRQHLIVLKRQIKRPQLTNSDHFHLGACWKNPFIKTIFCESGTKLLQNCRFEIKFPQYRRIMAYCGASTQIKFMSRGFFIALLIIQKKSTPYTQESNCPVRDD